ncbi:hypothetical protein RFI_26779 [Reticulomyxa filosa]|uniref:Uncharacterized protein n=1 Tax=Reticulomyxa filosa TaxID=46433 RepID=X6M9B9_RETFI|nr:hypothetical protein RFI_26779 [Reticulomyxa filosa]|eukprot:ETO10598.1 hypothetical protein RFI_26779 [Reticulomyxa filosa]
MAQFHNKVEGKNKEKKGNPNTKGLKEWMASYMENEKKSEEDKKKETESNKELHPNQVQGKEDEWDMDEDLENGKNYPMLDGLNKQMYTNQPKLIMRPAIATKLARDFAKYDWNKIVDQCSKNEWEYAKSQGFKIQDQLTGTYTDEVGEKNKENDAVVHEDKMANKKKERYKDPGFRIGTRGDGLGFKTKTGDGGKVDNG